MSLPSIFIQAVLGDQVHQCRCPAICEPNFDENLIEHVKTLLREEAKQRITGEAKANMFGISRGA